MRWNNAGLLGGRAFVDVLKWNVLLMDLDLTGNEIPEDTMRAISVGVERNKDRYKHWLNYLRNWLILINMLNPYLKNWHLLVLKFQSHKTRILP